MNELFVKMVELAKINTRDSSASVETDFPVISNNESGRSVDS